MEKSLIQSFVTKFEAAGITGWEVYCRGGNYELRHNGKDCFNILSDNVLIHLRNADGYDNFSGKAQFKIDIVPYTEIENISPLEVTSAEAVNLLLDQLSISDEDVIKFLKSAYTNHNINLNSKALSDGYIVGDDGKKAENVSGRSAYLVGADADRRSDNANSSSGDRDAEKDATLEKAKESWHQVVKEDISTD